MGAVSFHRLCLDVLAAEPDNCIDTEANKATTQACRLLGTHLKPKCQNNLMREVHNVLQGNLQNLRNVFSMLDVQRPWS